MDGHGGHPERDVEGAVPYERERTRGILAGAADYPSVSFADSSPDKGSLGGCEPGGIVLR